MASRLALPAAVLLAVLLGGCGDTGVSGDATVRVYVAAPLCAGARRELQGAGAGAQGLKVRAICLAPAGSPERRDLAAVGANARRASEDSAAVAYVAGPDPTAARFSRPIIETAGIAWVGASNGSDAMARVLRAIRASDRGSGSLRDEVREALDSG